MNRKHPKDIFNADETCLFNRCTTEEKTLALKRERWCSGGEQSKERIHF